MKSFLSLLFVILVFAAVVGGGVLIWYLNDTTEFSRKEAPAGTPNDSSE